MTSDIPSSPPTAESRPKRPWIALGVLVGMSLAVAVAVALLARAAPGPRRVAFDPSDLNGVRRQRPDVVIIGNSMVYTRLQESLLDDLIAPKRVKLISDSGTQSAIWYAQLKYSVVKSRARVKRVVIFFRDRELTLARARTLGRFSGSLERAVPGVDPVIQRKTASRAVSAIDHVRLPLVRLVPVERLRLVASARIDSWALRLFGARASVLNAKRQKKLINQVFEIEALRDVDGEQMASWDDPRPFAQGLKESFLPDILELAHENAIALSFVRVRRRRIAAGRSDSSEVTAYLSDLRRYLKRRGAEFLDLSPEDWQTLEMYGNGDHIASKYRAVWTKQLVARHPELFRTP